MSINLEKSNQLGLSRQLCSTLMDKSMCYILINLMISRFATGESSDIGYFSSLINRDYLFSYFPETLALFPDLRGCFL